MKSDKSLTVVDLDGTYVRGNTLHIYLECGMRRMGVRFKLISLCRALGLLAARKLGMVSHRHMKFGICRLIDQNDPQLRKIFVERVSKAINPKVAGIISQSSHVLLATAAPDTYIPWIWQGDFVATPMTDNPDMTECRGEEKLRCVKEYSGKAGLVPLIIVTDHNDDLPLMRELPKTILIDRSTGMPTEIKREEIEK